jgi:hypothetical protein
VEANNPMEDSSSLAETQHRVSHAALAGELTDVDFFAMPVDGQLTAQTMDG